MKKGKKGKIEIIILAVFLLCAVGLKIWQYHWPEGVVEIGGERLVVQIARTPYHHEKGLSGREDLGEYDGMLFIFNTPGRFSMVMREMDFDLDFIWFKDGQVVDIAPNALHTDPDRLWWPRVSVDSVLEVPAGWSLAHNIVIGDEIKFVQEY